MSFVIADNIISPMGFNSEENCLGVLNGRPCLRRYDLRWNLPERFMASLFSEEQRQELMTDGLTFFESLVLRSVSCAMENLKGGTKWKDSRIVFILSTIKADVSLLAEEGEDNILPSESAARIAQGAGIRGDIVVTSNACASGLSALILADRLLTAGKYDYAIVCGADVQSDFIVSGFQSLKALSPAECRPFDLDRTGLNLGEAAATMILAAQKPREGSLWSISGGSISNDAFHISTPSPKGVGLREVLNTLMEGHRADEIAFINAHGTATLFNDRMEGVAIRECGLENIPVTALKGYFGHTMGAAGVLETIICMHSLQRGIIPATRGFHELGVSARLDISGEQRTTDKRAFIKLLSGFGGCNAGILCTLDEPEAGDIAADVQRGNLCAAGSPEAGDIAADAQRGNLCAAGSPEAGDIAASESRAAYSPEIEGFGSCTVLHEVLLTEDRVVVDGKELPHEHLGAEMLTWLYTTYVGDYPKFYKMDRSCRLGFIASELLLLAEGGERFCERNDRGIILFNHQSTTDTDRKFYSSINDRREFYPSPSLFVYTLPNILTGEIAIRNHYHGETCHYLLSSPDCQMMRRIVEATFGESHLESAITGWVDFTDDSDFIAQIQMTEFNHNTRHE